MKAISACSCFFSIIFSLSFFSATLAGVLSDPIVVAVDPPIDGQSHLIIRLESILKLREPSIESVFYRAAIRGRRSFGGAYDLNSTYFAGEPPMPHFTLCRFEFEDGDDDEYDDASLFNGQYRGLMEKGQVISVQGATGVSCTVWISKVGS